ncbi:hypothetical protein ACHMZP_27550 [Rhodococcus baikonurensis]|uniref:hypothetical protein n=1 Tax=Rhodococcus baikonurensis TaxID=172041 RepID=UPI0037A7C7F8
MEPLVPDSVAVHPGCLLVKLGQVAFRLTENRLAPLGMRTRHYTLLKVLVAEGPLSQSELGRRSRIDPNDCRGGHRRVGREGVRNPDA